MALINVTLNPNDKNGMHSLSNGNLTDTMTSSQANIRATHGKTTGKWYWEVKHNTGTSTTYIGIANILYSIASGVVNGTGDALNTRTYYGSNGNKSPENIAYGTAWVVGDVIGVALDLDNGKLEFYKNGISMGVSHTNLSGMGEVFPWICTGVSTSKTFTFNFGSKPFAYPIPEGCLPYHFETVNKILISLDDNEVIGFKKGEESKNLVPAMTSDTTPSGMVSSNIIQPNYEAWNIFDRATGTRFLTGSTTYSAWIAYEFPIKTIVNKYTLITRTTGYEDFIPKNWIFEGTNNNGETWTKLDEVNNNNGILGVMQVFIFNNLTAYKKYRISMSNVNVRIGLGGMEMFETSRNRVVKFPSQSEQSFIDYGMDKPLELDMATVFTQREIISEDGTSTIIETEPFTLADEFEGKRVKIFEYTDNPSQVESVVETETEPYSIYEEFGDTMEVLYYTDDPDKSKSELEITANYSPLDEIKGDFEVVTWTDALEEVSETLIPAITGDIVEGGSVYATEIDLTDVVKVK